MFKNKASILLIASALLMLPGAAAAQPGKGKSAGVTATAASEGGAVTADSLMKRYENLAGSPANAESLVKGLRHQLEIVLVGASSTPAAGPTAGLSPIGPMSPVCPTCPVPPPPSDTVKFVPPTDPMGLGNIDIALALTEAQLNKQDVALPPKPAQLKDALMTVLDLRVGGSGWGDVAKTLDFELK